MNKRFAATSAFALFASGVIVACISSATPPGNFSEDAGFTPCTSDGSLATAAAQIDGGLCTSCVQTQCGALLTTCSTDCTCNDTALQALECIESLGATATTTEITSCVTPLGNSTDSTLEQLATCLQGCAGACGLDAGTDASIPEGGTDATTSVESGVEAGTDATVASEAGTDSGVPDTGTDASEDTGTDGPTGCTTTTISGTVYDPSGNNPLPGVNVFIPNGSLTAFPSGATCSCSGLQSPYLISTVTAADGTFTLSGLPEESSLSVVVQTGKWRRTFPFVITPCVDNPIATKLQLPSMGSQGNMPDIAVSTGGGDTLECLLSRIGIASTEFVAGAGAGGHVHMFSGGNATAGAGVPEANPFAGAPVSSLTLWNDLANISAYDVLVLSCEGGETYGANPAMLESYLNLGGRVLASHFHYSWFAGPLVSTQGYTAPADWGSNLATWTGGAALGDGGTTPSIGAIPQTNFAKGALANAWLGDVGALTSGELPILTPKYNAVVTASNAPSEPWLVADDTSGDPGATMLFTFDTPVNAPIGDSGTPLYCGRAAFTDLHDDAADTSNTTGGKAAPLGCAPGTLSPQEKELEYLFFDLAGCVVPDKASAGPPP